MAQDSCRNLDKYIRLSASFSKAAKKPEHLANPLFNIANCTRKSELLYPDLIGQKKWIWRLFDSFLGAIFIICRSILYFPNRISIRKKIEEVDVLIVSHLTNLEHLNSKKDFYFDNLASELNSTGISAHTCLINHIEATSNEAPQNCSRTILPAYLSPLTECVHILNLIFSISKISSLEGGVAAKRFSAIAKLAQFNSKAIGDYRIGLMLCDIIVKSKPKLVIHTYEGHGWEKILNAETRKLKEPPFVCGYQHAALFPGPKSICFGAKDASPMHIFTTGKVTCNALMRDCETENVGFSILGSNKNEAHSNEAILQSEAGVCLFAPEGTLNEVRLMAEIAVEAAIMNPTQKFVLRLHPVLRKEKVLKELRKLLPLPKNFELSEEVLNKDLIRSSWICYRGSSVVFQAILQRVTPIYLDVEDMAGFNDPLFGILDVKKIASSGQQLNAIINRLIVSDKTEQRKLDDAISYVNEYMMPFTAKPLIDLFNKQYNDRSKLL